MRNTLELVLEMLGNNARWMSWNLCLALVPLALAAGLFRRPAARCGGGWWLGLMVFLAFLPNAPYVLTDVIHLVRDIRYQDYPEWAIALVLVPQYALFMGVGVGAYVLSLLWLGNWLRSRGRGRWVVACELGLHGLMAVGVYLGRFLRLNSWDLVTQPDAVISGALNEFAQRRPLLILVVSWGVLTVIYGLLKPVILGWQGRSRSTDQIYG